MVYLKVPDSFSDITKTMLLYNWKSCCNSACEIAPKAEEVDPEGCKVEPPSYPLSSSPERFLLVFLADQPPAHQVEGATVGKGGDKDGVHDEEEKGEGAGAQQGGHQGGLGDATGPKGGHEEGEEEYEKTRGGLAGWKKKAEDAKESEQSRGEQVLLEVT